MVALASVGAAGTGALFVHTTQCLNDTRSFAQIPTWTFSTPAWSFVGWGTLALMAAFVEAHPPKGFYAVSGRVVAATMFVFGMCLAALSD